MSFNFKTCFCCILFLQGVLVSIQSGQRNYQFEHTGVILNLHALEHIFGIHTLGDCMYQCVLLSACKSVNYQRSMELCLPNSISSSEASQEHWIDDATNIFTDKADWPQGIGGTCSNNPCSVTSKCVPTTPPTCIAWCSYSPYITNAVYHHGWSVYGSFRTYECMPSYIMSGTATIYCQANSTWSPIMFTCNLK